MLNSAVPVSCLKLFSGETIASNDIRHFVEQSEKLKVAINHINNKVNNSQLMEALVLLGLGRKEVSNKDICKHLEKIDKGNWSVSETEDKYIFSKEYREVIEKFEVLKSLLTSPEIMRLSEQLDLFSSFVDGPAVLTMKDASITIKSPIDFFDKFMAQARKGITINRYKGLGEMNAEQLWETTIDPNARVLMQVKMSHLDELDDVFSTLMGEVVEPRRNFIQENALSVVNLDA